MTTHRFVRRPWTRLTTLVAAAAVAGCVLPHEAPATIDPTVTFAAHESHGGIVIDRMQGGQPAVLVPRSSWRFWSGPVYLLDEGGVTGGALAVTSPAHVVVRPDLRADAPVIDRVEPDWENGAVRLTLEPASGPALRTDVFARTSGGAGPSALSRQAQLSLDVPGTYEAAIHSPDGHPAGWIRVSIDGRNGPARYEAVLPPSVDEPLAAAAVQALSSEIAFIESTTPGVTRKSEER